MFPKEVIMNNIETIQNLIETTKELELRLNLLPYNGTPEIKDINNKKYLYVRKRLLNKVKSTYVGIYTLELYNILVKNNEERKSINKQIRSIKKELVNLGYIESIISKDVLLNIDFAKMNLKTNIYNQAILEEINITYKQVEDIIDNNIASNMSIIDIQKILNLKYVWEFITDIDILKMNFNFNILTHISKIVNERLIYNADKIRVLPVKINGTTYIPPIPNEEDIKNNIKTIINSDNTIIDKTIELCLYLMRTQAFLDGNKRTSIIFANYFLIKNAGGLIIIPKSKVEEFKKLLVKFYETNDTKEIKKFMIDYCYKKLK